MAHERRTIFPPEFRTQLERLAVTFARLRSSPGEGRKASSGAGAYREFSGHSPYTQGDDPRHLDWNAFGRLSRLFVKQYERERERTLTLVPDLTASLDDGVPDKRTSVLRITAAMAALALRDGATVLTILPQTDVSVDAWSRLSTVFDALESAPRASTGFLESAARRLCAPGRMPRNAVLVTDTMEDPMPLGALAPLVGHGRRLAIIGVLAPQDYTPAMSGAVQLVDSETSEAVALTLRHEVVQCFQTELAAHLERWRAACARIHAAFEVVRTDEPLDDIFVRRLPQAGVL